MRAAHHPQSLPHSALAHRFLILSRIVVRPRCAYATRGKTRDPRKFELIKPMHVNTPYLRYRQRTRALAMGIVLLYAMASVRSMVPGMCATQDAIDRQGPRLSSSVCCAKSTEVPSHRSGERSPDGANGPRCALCKLALTAYTTTPCATNGAALQPVMAREAIEPATILTGAALVTNAGRDPPAPNLRNTRFHIQSRKLCGTSARTKGLVS